MRRRMGTLAALGTGLALGAAPGWAAVTAQPLLELPAFAQPIDDGAGNLSLVVRYAAPTFDPENALNALATTITHSGGAVGTTTRFGAGARNGAPFESAVEDGETIGVRMTACQAPSVAMGCTGVPPAVTRTTRIDATIPTGTFRIEGGALATNRRDVTLTLSATDPLVGGIPGSASGVAQMAVDQDGDLTYPCAPIFTTDGDRSGCARAYATSTTATLTAGDGPKLVHVRFGDAARPVTAPCRNPLLCFNVFTGALEGNVSNTLTSGILLDTAAPTAVVVQDRLTVPAGGAVTLDASTSTDPGATPAGIDPATAAWQFGDGTAPVTGVKPTHTYAAAGTFTGSLTITDRAGNVSAPRAFTVTVTPAPTGGTTTTTTTTGGSGGVSAGTVGAVSTTGAFTLTGLRATARYRRSRLVGNLRVTGTADAAGPLTVTLTPRAGTARVIRASVAAGAFDTTLRLPAGLPPGTHTLTITAPGGTARSTLTLAAPREGVIGTATLRVRASAVTARFTLAARPVTALRRRLTVRVTQGRRTLATLPATLTRQTITVRAPALRLTRGTLTATLRAGTTVVGTTSVRVR